MFILLQLNSEVTILVEILKYCNWQRKVLGGPDFNSSAGLFNNDIQMDNISFAVHEK